MSEEIGVLVEEEFRAIVSEVWVQEIARAVLRAEGVSLPYEVSLVFAESEVVRQLNRRYRGVDEPTDVLAFGILPEKDSSDYFPVPPDGVTRLGEVVISYPQAVEQAAEQGHSTERELALLIVHGILHLLGYDHEEPEQEAEMRAKEKEVLERCLS